MTDHMAQDATGDNHWKHRAACKHHPNPDIFHPHPTDVVTIKEAKKVCLGCPVRGECMLYGLNMAGGGIWGGYTERELGRIRRGEPLKMTYVKRCELPPIHCGWCNTEFTPTVSNAMFCTPECGKLSRDERRKASAPIIIKIRTCAQCGDEFEARNARQKFCTISCRDADISQRGKDKRIAQRAEKQCQSCHSPFMPTTGVQLHCTRRCGQKHAQRARYKARKSEMAAVEPNTRNRGRSNTNERGSAKDRRARKQFLLDRDGDGVRAPCSEPGCRAIVDKNTMMVDRIIRGEDGGKYTKDNIKIHCGPCSCRQGSRRTQELRKAKAS